MARIPNWPVLGRAPVPAVPAEQVQATALNGAQIQSLLSIVQSVADGTLSTEAAEAVVRIAFPSAAEAAVDALLSALAKMPRKPQPEATDAAGQ